MYAFGSIFTPVSCASCQTGLITGPELNMVWVPTSNTCAMCGAWPARHAADDRGHQVLVGALEQAGDFDLVLAGVERGDQLVEFLAERGAHGVPQRDAGLLGGARRRGERKRAGSGQQSAAADVHGWPHAG